RVLLCHRRGARSISPVRLALWKKLGSWQRRLLGGLGLDTDGRMTVEQCRTILAHARPRAATPDVRERSLRIAHFVTALNSGGAERQACYAALGQHQHGHDVRLLTRLALVGEDAHYLPLLQAQGVLARFIGSRWDAGFREAWQRHGLSAAAFRALPAELAGMV